MEQDRLALQSQVAANLLARAPRRARRKEIVDDLHRPVKTEHALRLLFQVGRHRRDGIRTGERVVDGRSITRIAAEQRGVSAVQCGHDARLLFRREHGSRKNRRGGMGHGVVDMEHVQLMIAAYLGHSYRERQGVIRILEQIVIIDRHRMEMKPGRIHRQTERTLVTDEMHLMTPARQFFPQRGGKNAAATDRGVTSDADFHILSSSSSFSSLVLGPDFPLSITITRMRTTRNLALRL